MVDPETVVERASEAAHGYVFSQLSKSDVEDLDLTVSFDDEVLAVDVSIVAPAVDADLDQIADDAARIAGEAVDELFEDEGA
jgi:arginase family enzyme